jgi:cytochrome c oxidase subunit 3
MKESPVLDLSHLPMHGLGKESPTWWGTIGFMLLEGTGFALVITIYLYLGSLARDWPPAPAPDLLPGTALTVVLLASLLPNLLVARWAAQQNIVKVRIGIVVMSLIGIVPLLIRIFEFPALHVSWDTNAYGSIVWTLLGLHTTHLIADAGETMVLAVLMFTPHGKNLRRFGDVQDNAMYWNFVVLTWIPVYFCIYFLPRLL